MQKTFNGLQHHQSNLRHLQEKMKKHIEEMTQLPHIENDTTPNMQLLHLYISFDYDYDLI